MAGHNDHGHTLAGWTGATVSFIGFLVAGVFMVMAEPAGVWLGLAVIVVGGVVGLVMRGMGFGQKASKPVRMMAGSE
jgi:hypothetical protein